MGQARTHSRDIHVAKTWVAKTLKVKRGFGLASGKRRVWGTIPAIVLGSHFESCTLNGSLMGFSFGYV
jgi:hypothetical protein